MKSRILNWWQEQPVVLVTDPRWGAFPDTIINPLVAPSIAVANSESEPWVLIVAGGLLQVAAVEAARSLGLKILLTDRDPNCVCAQMADEFVELDTFDAEAHVALVRSWSHGLAAVFTAGADPVVTVSRAAQAAGCHHLPLVIARACADKVQTRLLLEKFGVPQPDFALVDSVVKLQSAVDEKGALAFYGDGCILKATGSSGSRGHTRGTMDEFLNATFAQEALERAQAHSPGDVLVEQLLTGRELSVETLWYDGRMIPLNAVERPFINSGRWAIELGHYNPAILTSTTYERVWTVMQRAGEALRMDATIGGHILKGDLILTDDGPKVLELTPRLSGGFDSQGTTPLAHGANYTKGALLLALDRHLSEVMPCFMPRWRKHAACLALFGPPEGGVIKEIQNLEDVRRRGDVTLRFESGDALPPLTDCAARVGFCFVLDDDPMVARAKAQDMVNELVVIVE